MPAVPGYAYGRLHLQPSDVTLPCQEGSFARNFAVSSPLEYGDSMHVKSFTYKYNKHRIDMKLILILTHDA